MKPIPPGTTKPQLRKMVAEHPLYEKWRAVSNPLLACTALYEEPFYVWWNLGTISLLAEALKSAEYPMKAHTSEQQRIATKQLEFVNARTGIVNAIYSGMHDEITRLLRTPESRSASAARSDSD